MFKVVVKFVNFYQLQIKYRWILDPWSGLWSRVRDSLIYQVQYVIQVFRSNAGI